MRLWRPSAFQADYLTDGGWKILKSAQTSEKRRIAARARAPRAKKDAKRPPPGKEMGRGRGRGLGHTVPRGPADAPPPVIPVVSDGEEADGEDADGPMSTTDRSHLKDLLKSTRERIMGGGSKRPRVTKETAGEASTADTVQAI